MIDWLINLPQQAGGEDLYDYWFRVWREPILWLAAAVILGALRAQHLYKLAALSEKLADAEMKRQSIAALCNRLKAHCETLERRIACAQDRSVEAGLSALAAVRSSKIDNLPGVLAAAVDLLFGPADYTVLIRRDGRLVEDPELSSGTNEPAGLPAIGRLDADLEALLLQETRILSILRESDARRLAGTALLAAPIVSSGSERVLGAVLIRTMDAANIGPHIEKNLQALCADVAHALRRHRVLVNFEPDRIAASRTIIGHAPEAGGAWYRYDADTAIATEQTQAITSGGRAPHLFETERPSAGTDAPRAKWSSRSVE